MYEHQTTRWRMLQFVPLKIHLSSCTFADQCYPLCWLEPDALSTSSCLLETATVGLTLSMW